MQPLKTYYPLRVSNAGHAIVSDVFPEEVRRGYTEKNKKYELEQYGGYVIAESLPPELAKELVELYNNRFGMQPDDNNLLGKLLDIKVELLRGAHPNETHNSFITRVEGRINIAMNHVQFGDKEKSEPPKLPTPSPDEDYMDINSPPGTKVTVSYLSLLNGSETYKKRAKEHLNLGRIYTVNRTEVHQWYTEVYLKEIPDVAFSSVQFVRYHEPAFDIDMLNKRKEEIEDSVRIQNDIKFQIDLIDVLYNERKEMNRGGSKTLLAIKDNLLAIKRWREGPVMKDIDCEKVIKDLVKVINVYEATASHTRSLSQTSAIQNAEAALGMLQALKEKREKYSDFSKSPAENQVARDLAKRGHIGVELKSTGESWEAHLRKCPINPKDATPSTKADELAYKGHFFSFGSGSADEVAFRTLYRVFNADQCQAILDVIKSRL